MTHKTTIPMTKTAFYDLALSFQGTESKPHFDRTGFKVTGKRMYATYLDKDHTTNIFLSPEEQAVFCEMHEGIYPVPNKWGEKGATTFLLDTVPEEVISEALLSAYNEILNPNK